MKKISVIVPNHPAPFEIYFSDDVLKTLPPFAMPADEDAFLHVIALAFLNKIDTRNRNHFYIARIKEHTPNATDASTHRLLVGNFSSQSVTPNFKIELDKKISSAKFDSLKTCTEFSSTERETEQEDKQAWEKVLSLVNNYTKNFDEQVKAENEEADKRAIAAFKEGRVVVPAPFPIPSEKIVVKFNAEKASELFRLTRVQLETIQKALTEQNKQLATYDNAISSNRNKLEQLLNQAKQESNDYDVAQLALFAQQEITAGNIEQFHAVASQLVEDERARINNIPAHQALDILLSSNTRTQAALNEHPILATIYCRFIDHEYHAAPFVFIRACLIWALKEAARQYYEEFKNDMHDPAKVLAAISAWGNFNLLSWGARITTMVTTPEQRGQYLEIKRQHFNEKFACVAIQITPHGQLVTYVDKPQENGESLRRVTLDELVNTAKLAELQIMIRTLLTNCNKSMYGSSSAHKKVTDCLNQFHNAVAEIHWSEYSKSLSQTNVSDVKNYKPIGIEEDFAQFTSCLFHYTDTRASLNPLSMNNYRVLKNLGGNVQFTWGDAAYAFETRAAKHCADLITTIAGSLESEGLISLIVADITNNPITQEKLVQASEQLSNATLVVKRIENNIATHKDLLMLQKKSTLPVNLTEEISATKIPDLIKKNEGMIVTFDTVQSGLESQILSKLKANATALQAKALMVANQAQANLAELVKIKDGMTARTLEQAGNDLMHMNHFKILADKQLEITAVYNAAISAIQLFLKTHAEEQAKITAFENELVRMLSPAGSPPTPAQEVVTFREIIHAKKTEFACSLNHASRKIDELTEALTKESNSDQIKAFTREINCVSDEFCDFTKSIERAAIPARNKVAINSKNHTTHIELLDLIIPVVKNLNYWQSLSSGGEPVIGDDGKEYKVPVGIAAMFNDIRVMNKIDYRTNPVHAEDFYIKLRGSCLDRKATNSPAVLGLFGGRKPITTDFYQAVTATETNTRIFALKTWIATNQADMEKSVRRELR